jgi:hypothetical protein
MKYYADELQVTQEMATKLRKRREAFRRVSKTKKMLFNTVITPYGLAPNKWSAEQIDHVVTADDLFELNKF